MRIHRPIALFVGFCLLTLLTFQVPALADDPTPVKVTLQAAIVKGAKPLKDDIKWSVAPVGKDGTAKQELTKAAPELALLPGKYRVSATLGFASVTREITVADAGKHEFAFDAGWARFQMVPDRKAKPIEEAVRWQIFRYTKGGVDEKAKVTELSAPSPQLTLPPGWYTVRAKYQGIVSEMVAEVKAGTLYKYTVVAYAGKATFAAVDAKGKKLKKDVAWSIERVSKDKGGKRVPVTTDSTAAPSLLLGEGSYVVVAKSGNLAGEAPFKVKAAGSEKVTVKLKPVAAAAGG